MRTLAPETESASVSLQAIQGMYVVHLEVATP